MSSQDTMQTAQRELSKAEEIERQAQQTMDTAQNQVDGFRQQAEVHRNEYTRLLAKAQDEQRQETEAELQAARDEQKKKDDRITSILG